MATHNCWRCLLRPSGGALAGSRRMPAFTIPVPGAIAAPSTGFAVPTAAAAPLSTSAILMSNAAGARGSKRFVKKKKAIVRPTRPVLPGERKAFRKRIQLSNNNALPVQGLGALTKENMVDVQSAGRILSLPDRLIDQLRTVEAFKPSQTWGFFHQPHTLVRSETVELARRMQDAAGKKETLRLVISGHKLSGKSMLLLHTMANAFLNDWIVISIPEGQELTTACTEYAPVPNTEPALYMQPVYLLNMLRQISKANDHLLRNITVLNSHRDIPADIVPHSTTLAELVAAAKEADNAWAVTQALWTELLTPGPDRRPVLLALDGLSHVMKISDYRSPAFELIHSHDLAVVRRFVNALTGPGTDSMPAFPAGGAVIAATSRGNAPKSFSMELALAQREAEQRGEALPTADPYCKAYDSRVEAALRSVAVLRAGALSREESRALMEYWAASGVYRSAVDTKKVADIMALGGAGLIGEMERAALLTMRL